MAEKKKVTKKTSAKKSDKRGANSTVASAILRTSKNKWKGIVKEETAKEKRKANPKMTKAFKEAAKRYKNIKLTWSQALKKAGSSAKTKKRKRA